MRKAWLLHRRLFQAALILTLLSACASVPRESADLSIELGKRISAIKKAHVALVDKYFDEKRSRVDEFIEELWVPEFAATFFANQQIADMWHGIVQSGDTADRLAFIVTLGPKLQTRINAKRKELVKPLDETEKKIIQQLNDSYSQARSINNSITSFLVSAVEVGESRNRYLEMIGGSDEKMVAALDQVDAAVDTLLSTAEQVADIETMTESYYQHLKDAIAKLAM